VRRVELQQDVLSWLPSEAETALASLGAEPYRGRQLFSALWRQGLKDVRDLTVWPAALRDRFGERHALERARPLTEQAAADGTVKGLLAMPDGEAVEAVLLPHRYGWSVCVSTQVGCAMGCHFCASGIGGRRRHLTAGEIMDQVWWAASRAPGRISRVDLMGIGEPLDNYAETVRFLRLVHEPLGLGLSYRHLTVSTSGLVPGILRLADEGLPVTLAVSLHAPEDDLRERLMPVNRAYPLNKLLPACEHYWDRTRRRVTFEYLLIQDVNDSVALARRLADRVTFPAHVNVIPWNPVPEHPFRPSPPEQVAAFVAALTDRGIPATVRRELGQEIQAACGQLRRAASVPAPR
jgi:23S rRNA (adenine2503-C2)-methyltransferase